MWLNTESPGESYLDFRPCLSPAAREQFRRCFSAVVVVGLMLLVFAAAPCVCFLATVVLFCVLCTRYGFQSWACTHLCNQGSITTAQAEEIGLPKPRGTYTQSLPPILFPVASLSKKDATATNWLQACDDVITEREKIAEEEMRKLECLPTKPSRSECSFCV